jgi:pyruvate/2-oxoglutarate dehydrogenase complex dihydrolipoamide dehydrogenase (E3) component
MGISGHIYLQLFILQLRSSTVIINHHWNNTTTAEKYDCIAIDSGEAGKLVPFLLSGDYGKKCAIIKRKWVGGSCLDIICLPSKNIMHSADNAHETRLTHKHGWDVKDAKTLKSDMTVMKNRKVEMLKTVNRFHDLFEQFKVKLIRAEGRFVGRKSFSWAMANFSQPTTSWSTPARELLLMRVFPVSSNQSQW